MTHDSALQAAPIAAPIREREERLADHPFLGRLGLFYIALSLLIVFALDRYWSANWDVEIFLHAARTFWDGGSPFDLYQKSRAQWPWPYPYPPLYAMLLAPLVWLADAMTEGAASAWPQLVTARLPVLLADVAIAALLHRTLQRATGERWLARLGAALWLFNPILFYQTAVQAHQESVWLLPTLAAYAWVQERRLARAWWPMLLLALAITLKQSAVIYAVPFGLLLLWERRWREVALFGGIFAALFGALSLPFHLYSPDFAYMVFEDVRQMPVQVQSWQVWTLALPGFLLEQTRTTFPTVRYAALLTVGASALLGWWALRKGRSWYAIGLLVTLAFVLMSQKVMAYHYPMLLPWLVAWGLRTRRFGTVSATLVWTAWVLVSPYFAPWADARHLPFYAALGTLNSLFYGWLLWQVLRGDERVEQVTQPEQARAAGALVRWMVLVALAFVLAILARPLQNFLPNSLPAMAALLVALLVATLLGVAPLAGWVAHALAMADLGKGEARLRVVHLLAAVVLVPLFFTWFTMTAEVTMVIEKGVTEAWGLEP